MRQDLAPHDVVVGFLPRVRVMLDCVTWQDREGFRLSGMEMVERVTSRRAYQIEQVRSGTAPDFVKLTPDQKGMGVMVTRAGLRSMRGIVHAAAARDKFSLARFEPGPQLKHFVDHYWIVRYDLPRGTSHTQTVLSYPNVHLAFEHDSGGRRALVYGVPQRPFVRRISGSGRTLGVRFRAGGFYPFWRRDVALLTGRTIPASEVFGPAVNEWLHAVLDAATDAAMAQVVERVLADRLPAHDARADLVAGIVQLALDDREIIKVEHLAERIEQDPSTSLTELAVELGYFDQAHFSKDFKSVLGQTPAAYRMAVSRQRQTEDRDTVR